jgi:hypothetical protein
MKMNSSAREFEIGNLFPSDRDDLYSYSHYRRTNFYCTIYSDHFQELFSFKNKTQMEIIFFIVVEMCMTSYNFVIVAK